MPVLTNSRHERFVQGIISGATATAAYIRAGYSKNGAAQSAQRLLKNVGIQARRAALEERLVGTFVGGQIAERDHRLAVYQNSLDRLLALIDERAVAYEHVKPGGATGLLIRRVRMIGTGKNTTRIEEYTFDRAVVTEIFKCLKLVAMEVGDWGKASPITEDRGPDYSHLTVEQLYAQRRIPQEAKDKMDAVMNMPVGLIEAAAGAVESN